MPDLTAILVTTMLSGAAATLCPLLGVPACALLAGRRHFSARISDLMLYLPLALPPIVTGLVLLELFHAGGPVGRLAVALGLSPPAFTFYGIVLAATVSAFPIAVRPMLTAAARLPHSLVEAYAAIGASPRQIAWRVRVPFAMPGIVAGTAVAFAHASGQFGAIYLIGGNIEGRTRTASIAVFDSVQSLNTSSAWSTTLVLTLVVLSVLGLGLSISRGLSRRWEHAGA